MPHQLHQLLLHHKVGQPLRQAALLVHQLLIHHQRLPECHKYLNQQPLQEFQICINYVIVFHLMFINTNNCIVFQLRYVKLHNQMLL